MNEYKKYAHSVVDVASGLASVAHGSSDGDYDHDDEVYQWLKRRLEDWSIGLEASREYDQAVFWMARQALKLYALCPWAKHNMEKRRAP